MRLAEVRRGQGRSCRVERGRNRFGDAERGWELWYDCCFRSNKILKTALIVLFVSPSIFKTSDYQMDNFPIQ